MSYAAAVRQYQNASSVGAAADASPHKLVAMLYDGALDRLVAARGALMRSDIAGKARLIGSAAAIIEHLRLCLDHQAGGELADNLDALYEYMGHRLLKANAENDVVVLDEVLHLMREIHGAWDGISQ